METRLAFSLFSTVSREPVRNPIVNSRNQLLALRSDVVLLHEQPDVPRQLKRRHRCCAGAARHSRRRQYRPVLTSVIMGNVRPRFFANIAIMFALCLVQEEMVKTGFCHESVQAASLVVEEQEVVGGMEADE